MVQRKCHFCGIEGKIASICMNTRDMEERAVNAAGSEIGERCYAALKGIGGGERSMGAIDKMRADTSVFL